MLHALNIFLHFPLLLLPCFSIVFVLRLELPFLQVQLLRLETLVVQGRADASIRNQLRVKLFLEFQQLQFVFLFQDCNTILELSEFLFDFEVTHVHLFCLC